MERHIISESAWISVAERRAVVMLCLGANYLRLVRVQSAHRHGGRVCRPISSPGHEGVRLRGLSFFLRM